MFSSANKELNDDDDELKRRAQDEKLYATETFHKQPIIYLG